ncbi:DUF1467 family protein [Parvularcula oceani]|uniref:DUF1467 family protein n=1 Tax=Parvularcula oceani TaxID=1247963 RepID=UPI0004E15DAE|nr:DUF1467 family protein [Parvularcula oceani]
MSPVGGLIIYLILWWVVFFAVLPMRVRSVWEDSEEQPEGVEEGAPVRPELWFKVRRTTWITALVWLVVAALIISGIFEPDV